MTHKELCLIAKKWLQRPNSKGGHGCQVALSECRSGWRGEIPDAIGFRAVSDSTETVVVEVKVSRGDFLADAKKPHRAEGEGMGMYRYFMCPEGMISPGEVPPRWGLLYVGARGQVRAVLGPVAESQNSGTFKAVAASWRQRRDEERETWLLVRVMARVSDPDGVKNTINAALKDQERLTRLCEAQSERIKQLEQRSVANHNHIMATRKGEIAGGGRN